MRLVSSVLTAADITPDPETTTLAAVLRMLDLLVESSEPAVVFTSAVRLCVPLICRYATVTMTESEQQTYAVTWPRNTTDRDHLPSTNTVRTLIDGQPTEAHPGYRGILTLGLHSPATTEQAALAELVVDRATALVHRARLTDLADRATARAVHLEVALASNRDIGVAIGILMSLHKVTRGHAFEALCELSQRTNRKVRDIAVDVIDTGTLEPLVDLRSAASSGAARVVGHRSGRPLTRCAP
jgi:ANTAR domain